MTNYWYESGRKFREVQYKNGKVDGLKTTWYEYESKLSCHLAKRSPAFAIKIAKEKGCLPSGILLAKRNLLAITKTI